MTIQLTLSIVAIVLSVCSFALSAYVAFRDRSRLKTESHAYLHEQTGEYYSFYFKAINAGRRPLVLTLIEGSYENNHKCGILINYENKGIRLAEGEFYEHQFEIHDGIMVCDPQRYGKFFNLVDLSVVDSASRKYRIKDAKENIQLLWASKHHLINQRKSR